MSAERAVQAALYTALTGNATYMALVTGLYDGEAPQGTAYPYTVIGEWTEVDEGQMSSNGWGLTVTLHDWSTYAGRKECQQIREARDAVLHRQRLTVPGFAPVYIYREFAEVFVERPDADQPIRHGVTRYRAMADT